jgi:hypothetical protein
MDNSREWAGPVRCGPGHGERHIDPKDGAGDDMVFEQLCGGFDYGHDPVVAVYGYEWDNDSDIDIKLVRGLGGE